MEKGEGVEVTALRKKTATRELQLPSKVGLHLKPATRRAPTAAAQEVQRAGARTQLGAAGLQSPEVSGWSAERAPLGKSHGPATPLLAVDSGDPGGALSYPGPPVLSREALLGPGTTVLPDV